MHDSLKAIIETQLIGAFRVAVTLPIEHVLDRIKTHKQSKLNITYLQSFLDIRSKRGWIGLYDGFLPSFQRTMLKQYYRWPMMILIPKTLRDHIDNPVITKILTGMTIGIFESSIITPFERMKTLKMTTLVHNFKYMTDISLSYIYVGYQIQTMRQIVSWTSYLFWDHYIRYSLKSSYTERITLAKTLIAASLTSFLNIAVVHPFDTVKTLIQMESNLFYRQISIYKSFEHVYQNYGLSGLYAGWQARVVAFFCQALLTTPTIDYLERQYGIAQKKK